jgi:class 3 adenylate cyclase/tetratricopeptide (TPR) repeat protein
LAVVFADLCGSTARSLSMEAELYADLLSDVRRLAREIVPRHGGIVLRTQGDGIVSIFGYPASNEDDSRHAIEATLELHAAVRRLQAPGGLPGQQPVALHSGIHAGRTLMRPGGLEGAMFELVGPVPNIAAHLSQRAEWDEVLVSEESLGPRQRHFVLGAPAALTLPGRDQPLTAVRVLARADAPSAAALPGLWRARAPLAGRLAELLALARHLQAAAGGSPRLVAVLGDPGIGKTRLLEEFLNAAAADVHAVHRGYCESGLSAEPLQPFLQIVRTLVGITPGLAPQQAARSVDAFVAPLGPDAAELRDDLLQLLSLGDAAGSGTAEPATTSTKRSGLEHRVAALRSLFGRLARMGPQVIFLDDWHWADDASRQVLDGLLGSSGPLLVVVAARAGGPADPALAGAERIALEPLALEEANATIARLLPAADPFVAGEIHRYSGGIPLYIEELCHLLRAEGGTARLERLHPGSVWLNAVIEARVARLAPRQAELVRAAAIVGNVFPAWLLERLTGAGEHDPVLRSLAEHDLVFPADKPGMLRFKHGITRDVIYESVGLREKTALHLRIAEALAADADAPGAEDRHEALAYHYGAAGRRQEAAHFAELAGDKAMAASALDRARVQYRAALDALDVDAAQPGEARQRWLAVVQRLGMACVFDPLGLDDGLVLFERAVVLARDGLDTPGGAALLARAEYWLSYIAYARGEVRTALRHGEQALARAEQAGDVRLAAQVRATLGQTLASAADYERALPLLEQSIDIKRRNVQSGARLAVGSSYSLATKGLVLGDRGEFGAAHECMDEALALVAGSGHQIESSVLGWRTAVLMWQGRWAEAIDSAARSSAIAARCKSTHLYAMHLAQMAYAEWVLARSADALHSLQEATAWIEARHGRMVLSLNHGWLADARVDAGQPRQARAHAAGALRRARALDRVGEAMACRAMARAAALAGRAPRALHWLALARRAADARASAHEAAVNEWCEAAVQAHLDHADAARRGAERAHAAFERLQMPWHLAQVQALTALLASGGGRLALIPAADLMPPTGSLIN